MSFYAKMARESMNLTGIEFSAEWTEKYKKLEWIPIERGWLDIPTTDGVKSIEAEMEVCAGRNFLWPDSNG